MHFPKKKTDIAIFIPSFGSGGADRMTINLCRGFSHLNYNVDLIVTSNDFFLKKSISSNIRILRLSKTKRKLVHELAEYLQKNRPKILLSTKGGHEEAIKAKNFYNTDVKIVLRHITTFSIRDSYRPFFKRVLSKIKIKKIFSKADLIIAVSKGAAKDIINIAKIPKEKVKVVPNPTITPEICHLSEEDIDHHWFKKKDKYIILGAGGFRKSKDFPTLIKAFNQLIQNIPARLVILGDGRQRKKIESTINKLGLKDKVWLPGFVENPYKFMAKSDLFVLSSLWEGCPNVLIEAMSLGTPVVSTDCPSGPREILDNGKYGILVPPNSPKELAEAMLLTLRNPPDPEVVKNAVKRFDFIESCISYIRAFNINL